MIQRIQTVYLILALTCTVLLLFYPIFSVQVTNDYVDDTFAIFGPDGIVVPNSSDFEFPMYWAYILLSFLSLFGIILFKNRKKQLLVTRVNLLLHIITVIVVYGVYFVGQTLISEHLKEQGREWETAIVKFNMSVGFFLVIPAMVFVFLAIRGIKTDIKLTQMADRLR